MEGLLRRANTRRAGVAVAVAATVAALAFASGVWWSRPVTLPTVGTEPDGIRLNFGLQRKPVTRSLRLDLCATKEPSRFAECKDQPGQRPEVRSVILVSDLVDSATDLQFPAGQVVLNATNVGQQGLLVSVSADPLEPDDIESGTYRGKLVIDRSDGSTVGLDLVVTLRPRTGNPAHRAVVALLIGAIASTLLRWVDASFTPLAALRRRQRRLEEYLRRHGGGLPEGVVHRLEDVRLALASFDPEGVAGTLDEIVKNQDALVEFAGSVEALRRTIVEQQRLSAGLGMATVEAALDVERDFLEQLRHRIWPWNKAEEITASLGVARTRFSQLTAAIRRATAGDAAATRRLEALATLIVSEGPDGLSESLDDTVDVSEHDIVAPTVSKLRGPLSAPDVEPHALFSPTRRTLSVWLLDHAWWITLAAGALAVCFVGFQQQFLDNAGFEGDASDYVKLAAWGFAIQLAGGTIVETVGKLTSAARPGAGTGA